MKNGIIQTRYYSAVELFLDVLTVLLNWFPSSYMHFIQMYLVDFVILLITHWCTDTVLESSWHFDLSERIIVTLTGGCLIVLRIALPRLPAF